MRKRMVKKWPRRLLLNGLLGAMVSGGAHAVVFDTGNPELSVQLGNTLRYNSGWRIRNPDPLMLANPNTDDGSSSFKRGAQVTSRIDWLAELDVDYSRMFGLRASAAAWQDFAFHDDVRYNPAFATRGSNYNSNVFSDRTKRYQKGLSGEFLDAYIYGKFNLGATATEVRVGQQTVLWGEALILQPYSVSDNQSATDAIKLLSSPGVDAKEAAIPIGQISAKTQIGNEVTLLAQYYYDFRNSRAPQGGTYLGATDFLLDGPDKGYFGPFALTNLGFVAPKKSGDWGIGARWSPDWMDGGTLGVYYREYTDKSPSLSLTVAPGGSYRLFFPRQQKLIGLSMSRNIGGASVGFEITRRQNAVLNSVIQDGTLAAARGNAWTALANAMYLFGPNVAWSTATLIGEVGYSRLGSVTANPTYFVRCGAVKNSNCGDDSSWMTALRFTPTWTAVVPGWDTSLNLGATYVIKGNSPLSQPDHGFEHGGSYSVGNTWTYNTRHDFTLAYIGYLGGRQGATFNGPQRQDRNWLSFTYKVSF